MPRRGVLTASERDELFALPETDSQLTQLLAFGEVDLATVRRHRGDANRIGFAVQLCLLRYPGTGLFPNTDPPALLIRWVGRQLGIDPELWQRYADRDATRRDHHFELRSYLGLRQFRGDELRETVASVVDVALRSDKGIVLARYALDTLRRRHIIVPAIGVIERICAEAITRANRRIFRTLSRPLSERQRRILDALLSLKPQSSVTWLTWLRQPPLKPNSRHMLDHLDRLRVFQAIAFYTHVSDQYAPFSVKLVNVGIRDSTYVLDGLLYHESDLRIEEHYTDTAGFTDHVFALMHLLGFRFAPRIRDLKDTKIFVPEKRRAHSALNALIGGAINIRQIRTHWDEILRLATSIRQGTVTASLILRKLASYPRQNGLAVALREFGRIERTLFILDWLQSVEIRRRVNDGLNKGEARNALARAVFFNRLGEIRDHGFDQQRYRASGLNLATAAIALWNTVYLERAVASLMASGASIDTELLQYLSPLGWGHINLTGDYLWRQSRKVASGRFRPLRPVRDP